MDWFSGPFQAPMAAPQQQPQPQKKKGGRGGFLTSLISEGGALGGAALGASIGSVVPIVGTALGGAVGAGLGAFGGRLAENQVRDSRWGVGDAAKEGALSAVLSAPLKGAKYAATAGKGLIGKEGLEAALTQGAKAADSFALTGGLKKAAGGKLISASDNVAQKALKINDANWATQFANRTGEEIGQFANRLGIVGKPVDAVRKEFINPAQELYQSGVKAIGTIPRNNVMNSVKVGVQDLLTSSFPEDRAFGKSVLKKAEELVSKYGDEIPATEINKLKGQAYRKVNVKLSDTSGLQNNDLYERLGNAFRKTIGETADQKGIKIDPEVLRQAGLNFKSTNMNDLGQELFGLEELTKKIDVKSRTGAGRNLISLDKLGGAGAGGAAIGGPAGMALGYATATAMNSNAGKRAITGGLKKVGSSLTEESAKPLAMGLKEGLAGVIGNKAFNGQSLDESSNMNTNDSMATNAMAANMPGQYQNPTDLSSALTQGFGGEQMGSSNPYSKQNLIYDIQRDPKNAKEYIAYYKELASIFEPAADKQKPLSQGQQERQDLLTAITNTEGAIDAGSINYGPVGGRLNDIRSMFNAGDAETLNFKNTVSGLRAAIAKARAGASMSEGEKKMLSQYTPSYTDSEQVVRSKMEALRQLYGYSAPAGGSTLEDMFATGGY